MFGPKRQCVVVVGAQWGDEGKGKIVDVLAERADLVVRYQGGANAGHTVVKGDEEFILHQIPSGILHEGSQCLIGNGVVLDPETLVREMDELAARGVRIDGRLLVSDRAHLVMPYHKLLDRASERQQQIGTTGRGIGPAYEDKIGRRGIRVGDLRHLDHVAELIAERTERANRLLALLEVEERASATEQTALVRCLAPRLLPLVADAGHTVWGALRDGRRVLLEGAQGALLDVDHGTYPFVTSSNTTAGGAAIGAGIGPTAIDAVLGVVKAYTTRVGNGPLPTEAMPPLGDQLRRGRGAICRARERAHSPRRHQARRAGYVRRDPGVHRVPGGRRAGGQRAVRRGVARAGGAGLRGAAGMAASHQQRAPPGRPAAAGPRVPRPASGPGRNAHRVRERGEPAGPDHRDVNLGRLPLAVGRGDVRLASIPSA
jgi:adenylosuccinate synthase